MFGRKRCEQRYCTGCGSLMDAEVEEQRMGFDPCNGTPIHRRRPVFVCRYGWAEDTSLRLLNMGPHDGYPTGDWMKDS